jgi:hypothetical protein
LRERALSRAEQESYVWGRLADWHGLRDALARAGDEFE